MVLEQPRRHYAPTPVLLVGGFIAAYSIITVASIKQLGFYQAVIQFYENNLIVPTSTILPALAFAKP
eukprot:4365498-Pleurochrysis_carterae.AAC.1